MTYESLAVAGVAVPLTAATYGRSPQALITVETAPIRFSIIAGVTPVAGTTGHLAQTGQTIELYSAEEIQNFQAIRETGVSAALKCSYGDALFVGGRD